MRGKSKNRLGWFLVVILLASAASRMVQLTWRSLDADEGISLFFADLSYSDLFRHIGDLTLDRHPLFYYVLLKVWRGIAGDSDQALRILSVFLGMLTIAIVYQIGRRRLGRNRALVASLFFGLNPLMVYQHQDVRMYSAAVLFTAIAFYIVLAVGTSPRWPQVIGYFVLASAVIAAVYTHVLAVTIIPVLGIWLLYEARRRPAASTGRLIALAISGIGILPYFINIYRSQNQGSGALELEGWYRTLLGAAKTLLDPQSILGFDGNNLFLLGLLLLIVGGAIYRDRKFGILFALWLLITALLNSYVALKVAFFTPKLFAFATIPLSYLLAIAILGRGKTVSWPAILSIIAILGFMTIGLFRMFEPDNQRENFRSAATFVEQYASDQDRVFVHLNWYQFVFGHYYDRPFVTPFANNVTSLESVEAAIEPHLGAETIWLVQAGTDAPATGLPDYIGDQGRLVQRWFEERYPLAAEVFPAGVDVQAYTIQYRFDQLPASAEPLNLQYQGGPNLAGYRLSQREFPTNDVYLHPPSSWVPLTLYWSTDDESGVDFMPSITLEDEQGQIWGGVIPREKGLRRFYPPDDWQAGEIVRWDFDVNANPDIPPGSYKLVLRVTGPDAAPLNHDGGVEWFILDRVALIP